MSSSPSLKFWISLVLFQLFFGFSVFGVTRFYYLGQHEEARIADSVSFEANAFPTAIARSMQNATALSTDLSFPDTPEAMAQRADVQFQARNYSEAASLYSQLVELDPTNVALLNNLAITLQYLGRSDEAIAYIDRGLATDPNHQRSWLTLGFISAQVGDQEEARTALTQAIRLDPDNEVASSAGRMLEEMGIDLPSN